MKKVFDLSEYKKDKVAMYCDTKEKAKIFCIFLYINNMKLKNGNDYNEKDLDAFWNNFNSKICYDFNNGFRGTLKFFNYENYKILNFDDFVWLY